MPTLVLSVLSLASTIALYAMGSAPSTFGVIGVSIWLVADEARIYLQERRRD